MEIESIKSIFVAAMHSDVALGIALTAAMSYSAMVLYKIAKSVLTRLHRLIITSVIIEPDDPFVLYVNAWLGCNGQIDKSRRLTVSASKNLILRKTKPQANYMESLAPGKHWLWLRNRPLLLEVRESEASSGQVLQSLKMTLYSRDRQRLMNTLNEAYKISISDNSIRAYTYRKFWVPLRSVRRRKMEAYASNDDTPYRLLRLCRDFLASETFYLERGLPYRLGILLTGQPGTGKTSLIITLASELGMPVYTLSLSAFDKESDFLEAVATIPARCVVVIEDIDTYGVTRSRTSAPEKEKNDKISLSALLNVIDGICGGEDRILFMTTNHPELIDRALVRPGRIDKIIEIEPLRRAAISNYLNRFYTDICDGRLDPQVSMTGAELQKICMQNTESTVVSAINSMHTAPEKRAIELPDRLYEVG